MLAKERARELGLRFETQVVRVGVWVSGCVGVWVSGCVGVRDETFSRLSPQRKGGRA